ncbi:MAG: hypothetical protein JF603_10070 [Acidobacteria bacterium]|nr:hypothetical protein [Acidobacteriota bacterium]
MIHADPGFWHRGLSGMSNINDGGHDAPLTERDSRAIALLIFGVLAFGALVALVVSVFI